MRDHQFHFYRGFSSPDFLSKQAQLYNKSVDKDVLTEWTMCYKCPYINFIPKYVHIVWISIANVKNFGKIVFALTICAAISSISGHAH